MPDTAIFDHYEVLTRDDGSLFELGRGAMGITYKAFDTSLRIPVALKVINATYLNSEVARQRFVREARSAAQLRHRNVASVFHLGTEGDTWFYAMEFIDGETLDAVIKRQGILSPPIALTIAGQVARALNAAAQHGLVHRDIKPANLMLVKEDDELVAKVIDFGLAKAAVPGEGEDAATLSMGGFVGTPHFASPEQLEEKEIDTRSDIYSLGVTLWYMLAGQAPFAGSMAQVMSQHLTKPPPFEKLDKLPPAVAEVLRKMLAKDPADRYQTPADLRKAIEVALENLDKSVSVPEVSTATSAAPAPTTESLEEFATLLEDSSRPGFASFETNSTIANRYRVARSCGETNAGKVFRAYDTERKMEVRLIVLHPEALSDTLALAALEREVERLVPVKNANLLGVFGFETVDRGSFLVLEWTEGFTLLDLLKARRELDADEALKILAQSAEGADCALGLGLCGLEFGLHQIQIHFPGEIDREKLLRTPLRNWPAFFVKLYPLGATREFAGSQTWAGAQTMVASCEAGEAPSGDVRPQYVQSLAAVTYELLGGTLSPVALRGGGGASLRYTPLSTLSEEGNEVLRRALDCGRSYPSAREFSSALSNLDGLQTHRHESKAPLSVAPPARTTTAPPAPRPAPPAVTTAVPPLSRPPIPQAPAYTPPKPKGVPIVLISGIAAALLMVAAAAFYFYQQKSHSTAGGGDSPTPPPVSDNPSTGGSTSSTQQIADNPPVATPIPATPVPVATPIPVTPIPVTPIPGPTRQDMLKSAVAAAQDLEDKGDWPRSLASWMSIARDYQDFPVGRNHLETMLNHLRDRPAPISFEEFQSMRGPITEAAQMGILSAMLLIGDNLRIPEPKTAAHWFSVAADKGDVIGLVQYGLMLRRGEGVDKPDPETAFSLFQKANDAGDINAKLELGECYLHGIGIIPDEKRGFEMIRDVADAGNSRAMGELGYCYSHGVGVERDYHIAFQWYSKSAEKGNMDAAGNLGVLYLRGWGVAANPKKAVELFENGAKTGNPMCMQLYASALEEGLGTTKNVLLATSWYRKAAKAGSKTAIDWCHANAVSF